MRAGLKGFALLSTQQSAPSQPHSLTKMDKIPWQAFAQGWTSRVKNKRRQIKSNERSEEDQG
jgi:hypothetical protein